MKNFYVYSYREGSVIFSWHDVTLSAKDGCPDEEIQGLAMKYFEQDGSIKREVQDK